MTVTADDVDTAISHVVATLSPATDGDWSVPAGTLVREAYAGARES